MRWCFSSEMGPLRGLATKRWPQRRQRNVGVPTELTPLRTTGVTVQREQGGIRVGSDVVFILPVY